ncbi:MAG: diguanylate cyclase [Anaerolineaceae bacterium]|nr:diguanylate cyclase [Anaerolineaceae bacterium]
MQQAPTIILIILYLVGLVSTYLAAWAQLRSRVPAAKEFFFLLMAVAVYAFGYAVELSRINIHGVLQAIKLEYIGLAFIPSLLLVFVYHYIYKHSMKRKYALWFFIIPTITLLLVFSINSHSLFYINPQVVEGDFFPVLSFEKGNWYYVNFLYQQLVSITAIVLLALYARRNKGKQRKHAIAIIVAAIMPLLGSVFYIFGLIPGQLDPGPFTLSITSLIISVGIFRLGLFELVPAAREFALDSIRDGFLVVDKKCRLQDMNKAARALPGANKLIIGETLPKNNPFVRYLAAIIDGSEQELKFSVDGNDGNIHYYQATAYAIETNVPYEKGTTILISDITDSANLMKMLSHKSQTDELTGLLNRRQLIRLGDNEIKRSKQNNTPIGVILIDLDHFKSVNEDFGQSTGDHILKEVTKCFASGLRNVDIFGRYGGEEFVIFLPNTDMALANTIAERLKEKILTLKLNIDGKEIDTTASFGVHATVANSLTTIDTLINVADKALRLAKNKGRNQVALSSDIPKE